MSQKGLTLVALVITIIVLLILAGVSLSFTIGENGILTKAGTTEIEFNKSEVLEQLNIIITEKYLSAYNESLGKNIEDYYSTAIVIQFLKDNNYIEDLKDASNNVINDKYFIKIESLNSNIKKYGLGANGSDKDYFFIEKEDEKVYSINYISLDGAKEKIGDLQIQQNL